MITVLQVIGTSCVLLGTYFTAHKKRAAWVVYQLGGLAWIALYLRKELYIAIMAQLIYMTMNVYGWIAWGKGRGGA